MLNIPTLRNISDFIELLSNVQLYVQLYLYIWLLEAISLIIIIFRFSLKEKSVSKIYDIS